MKASPFALITGLVLAGCSASPFDTRVETGPRLDGAPGEQPESVDAKVLWGGQIVDAARFDDGTRLEIRAHQLGLGDRPLVGVRASGVHFVVRHPEMLDLDEYGPGRFLTAMGTYTDIESVKIADREFQLPVMASEQIELWPAEVYPDSLEPLGRKDYSNDFPRIVTPSTASAGFARSSGVN